MRSFLLVVLCVAISMSRAVADAVTFVRVPDGGIQPRIAVDDRGGVHMVYFRGDPGEGDLYYTRWDATQMKFIPPIRVNSQPKSSLAIATIRGGQIAVGKNGRVHIIWNGSSSAAPKGPLNPNMPSDSPYNGIPVLYSRLNDARTAFEPQRNVMKESFALDGGAAIAADRNGNVYVAWHASSAENPNARRVFVALSSDDGKTFSTERPVTSTREGACPCCSTHAFADSSGAVYIMFRSAEQEINRDMILLVSKGRGKPFDTVPVERWRINT